MKSLILLSLISFSSFASDRVFWSGEVSGLGRTERTDVWTLKTKKKTVVTLDCASYIHHLGIKEGEVQGMIALSESECHDFSKKIRSWTSFGKRPELVIDSYEEPVLYRK